MRTLFLFIYFSLPTSVLLSQTFIPSELQSKHRFLSEDDALDSLHYWAWDTIMFEWQLVMRTFYTTDANNNILTQLSFGWDGTQWINQDLNTYTFDKNNNLVNDLYQTWNGTNWENIIQTIYTFDANDDEISEVRQNWDGTGWVNSLGQFYTYDKNHNLLSNVQSHWLGTEWQGVFQRIYTYDENNRRILQLVQNWISGWVNNQQIISTYDANDDLDMDFNQRWVVDHWEDNYRNLYDFNANHYRTLILRQNPAGDSIWIDDYQYIYAYDLDNNLISLLSQTYANNVWTNGDRFSGTYDSRQNRITEVYQLWETEWINYDSIHFYYTIATGIKYLIYDESGISLYPNPASTSLNINLTEEILEDIIVDIYSSTGIKLIESRLSPWQNKDVNISNLLPGFYHVVIQHGERITTRNFVKK